MVVRSGSPAVWRRRVTVGLLPDLLDGCVNVTPKLLRLRGARTASAGIFGGRAASTAERAGSHFNTDESKLLVKTHALRKSRW